MDFLKSAVASAIVKGPPFPYSFNDKLDIGQSIWTLHNGTRREDGSNCSILSFDVSANKSRLPLARNALKRLRTLRHPGIIKVLDSVETESYIYIAIERVVPLRWHLRRRSLAPEAIKWGLYSVARTVKFINGDAASVHGGIKVDSIYTSESGEWKLGGFEVLSSLKDDNPFIYTYGGLVPDSARYAPPEVARGGWDALGKSPHSAVDSFNFGTLIFELFNGDYRGTEQVGQTTNVPSAMQAAYRRLCNASPKARITVSNFVDQGSRTGSFFDSPLIKVTEGIENFGIKSADERDELLSDVDKLVDEFPEEFLKLKLMPELMQSVEFGGGGPKALAVVLKMASKISGEDFDARVAPFVVRVFGNPDRAIRVCLLDCLPLMIDRLPQKIVNDKIFPQLATGFTDVAPVIREQTLKSVLTIVPKLSDRTINGELLRYLAKTANDEQPGIRANTTICLGKMAKHLGTSSRSKVLIAAFSRSLRDPFVHARHAALMALSATADYFTDEDCAGRVLPVICPLLIDKEKLVRDQAGRAADVYLQKIRKAAAGMPDTALPPTQGPEKQGSRTGTPQPNASSGWAGWAISSVTSKLSSATGEMQTANGTSAIPPLGLEPKRPGTTSASPLHRQALQSPPPPVSRTSSSNASAVAEAFFAHDDKDDDGGDLWADMDDMDDMIDDDEGVEATPKPAPKEKQVASASATPFEEGEPDFEGWLAAKAQKKLGGSKPLPKGLSKPSAAKKPLGSKAGTKLVATKKPEAPVKPVAEDDDDGWGEGW